MGKSYRKPYSAITGVRSAHDDKTVAARAHRRNESFKLRSFCGDWDDYIHPVRREAAHNNTYSWSRDGRQQYQMVNPNHKNIYYVVGRWTQMTEEQLIERRDEWIERDLWWQAYIRRK